MALIYSKCIAMLLVILSFGLAESPPLKEEISTKLSTADCLIPVKETAKKVIYAYGPECNDRSFAVRVNTTKKSCTKDGFCHGGIHFTGPSGNLTIFSNQTHVWITAKPNEINLSITYGETTMKHSFFAEGSSKDGKEKVNRTFTVTDNSEKGEAHQCIPGGLPGLLGGIFAGIFAGVLITISPIIIIVITLVRYKKPKGIRNKIHVNDGEIDTASPKTESGKDGNSLSMEMKSLKQEGEVKGQSSTLNHHQETCKQKPTDDKVNVVRMSGPKAFNSQGPRQTPGDVYLHADTKSNNSNDSQENANQDEEKEPFLNDTSDV